MTITTIEPTDYAWPLGLFQLGPNMPKKLYVDGAVSALHALRSQQSVSVVGSRAATSYGEHTAAEITSDLVRMYRAVIVSGLAYGIDAAAHRAALASGGITIAFLAGGLDRVYPIGNKDLSRRIVESGGALVSEYRPDEAPTRQRVLERNKLIAAASSCTLVIEAGWRSGSLATARRAKDLGRPVFAVPGPVTSPASAGTNLLIQQDDARLVFSADDIWTVLNDNTLRGAVRQ